MSDKIDPLHDPGNLDRHRDAVAKLLDDPRFASDTYSVAGDLPYEHASLRDMFTKPSRDRSISPDPRFRRSQENGDARTQPESTIGSTQTPSARTTRQVPQTNTVLTPEGASSSQDTTQQAGQHPVAPGSADTVFPSAVPSPQVLQLTQAIDALPKVMGYANTLVPSRRSLRETKTLAGQISRNSGRPKPKSILTPHIGDRDLLSKEMWDYLVAPVDRGSGGLDLH